MNLHGGPTIEIDLDKIERNAAAIVAQCAEHGVAVVGVTKVTCGMPHVARALLRAGVSALGESRLENVMRLRDAGITAPIMMLRIPPISAAPDVVDLVDVSLNSEIKVLRALSDAALSRGRQHDVIIMVDLGDLREGVWPDDLVPFMDRVWELEGVRVIGMGANLSCYGGVVPSADNLGLLVRMVEEVEQRYGVAIQVVSGGNSSSLPLMRDGRLPRRINQLRIGEAIMLGRETVHGTPWHGTVQDAFTIRAEIIELKRKPSVPIGVTTRDAFGGQPAFSDRGVRLRAILNTGREDVLIDGLRPLDPRVRILGASSDHMILDVEDSSEPLSVGDRVAFLPDYGALLAAMTSAYIQKVPRTARRVASDLKRVTLLTEAPDVFPHRAEIDATLPELGVEPRWLSVPPLPVPVEFDSLSASIEYALALSERVAEAIRADTIPVLLGDNDVQRVAAFLALRRLRPDYGLIIFDAHANFHTPASREESCPGRMILAAALGHGIERLDLPFPLINPENTVLVGVRQVAQEERALLERSRVTVFTIEDIDSLGIREVIERAIRIASMGTMATHVSVDMDVLDPEQVPKLRMPVEGGLTYREAHLCMEIIARSRILCSLDILPIQNRPDADPRMAHTATALVLSIFGKRIFGRAQTRA
jgi:arginase